MRVKVGYQIPASMMAEAKRKRSTAHILSLGTPEAFPMFGHPMPPHINSYTPEERRQIMVTKLRGIVSAKGGAFDESAYKNKRTPIEFRCAAGHVWTVQPGTVLTGSWCRVCWEQNEAGNHLRKDGLTDARKVALARGGECLSDSYVNAQKRLHWQCRNGHDWFAALNDIKKGTWCPVCGSGARERLCRHYFEAITGHRFPKVKPKWLLNDLGNRMELDGYNENLKLAFEHQGEQHYRPIEHFNRREETLTRRQRDDKIKQQFCDHQGISLIAVPFDIPTAEMYPWIVQAIKSTRPDMQINENVESIEYVSSDELEQLKAIARQRRGDCISPVYLGVTGKHRFRCAEGHEWEATAANVKLRTWCPVCKLKTLADKRRLHSVESMQKLAQTRGGSLISKDFNSVNDKYRWRCANGHEWSASPKDIFKGTWCRMCSIESKKGTLEEAREIARIRGGECLSTEYGNTYSKLRWRCGAGHEWNARMGNVKNRGSWCPECARKRQKIPRSQL